MKTLTAILTLNLLLPFCAHAIPESSTYTNALGCVVEVEPRRNGTVLYVTSAEGQTAVLGVLNDLSQGEIAAFCPRAEVQTKNSEVLLSCAPHEEAGSYTTRGQAKIDFTKGLSTIAVRGEYKKFFGWKVDTLIVCEDLKKQ